MRETLGDDSWVIAFLAIVCVASASLALKRMAKAIDYIGLAASFPILGLVTSPSMMMVVFYLAGWQWALLVKVLLLALEKWIAKWWVDRRFPDVPRRKTWWGEVPLHFIGAGSALFVAYLGNAELLRLLPIMMAMMAIILTVQNYVKRATQGKRHHSAVHLGLAVLFAIGIPIVSLSELLWHYTSLEVWMWFFAFIAPVGMIFGTILVAPNLIRLNRKTGLVPKKPLP